MNDLEILTLLFDRLALRFPYNPHDDVGRFGPVVVTDKGEFREVELHGGQRTLAPIHRLPKAGRCNALRNHGLGYCHNWQAKAIRDDFIPNGKRLKWPSGRCRFHGGNSPQGKESVNYYHGDRTRDKTLRIDSLTEWTTRHVQRFSEFTKLAIFLRRAKKKLRMMKGGQISALNLLTNEERYTIQLLRITTMGELDIALDNLYLYLRLAPSFVDGCKFVFAPVETIAFNFGLEVESVRLSQDGELFIERGLYFMDRYIPPTDKRPFPQFKN